MKIDWEIIKEKIINNVSEILNSGTPNYSDLQVGLDLFRRIILYTTNIHQLDGLPRILLPSLQEAYIDSKGEIGPLRQIADSLEPYLKKIILLVKNKQYQDISDKNLIALFKLLELNKDLTIQNGSGYPQLEKVNLDSFKGKPEYLEYLCHSRLIRNEVHNSPNWNEIDIFTNLRNILVIYLYATFKYSAVLSSLPKREIPISEYKSFESEENKILYDFISFGNTTTEIKTQILNAYILNHLMEHPKSTLLEIKDNANGYFDTELNSHFYERRINNLIQTQRIEYKDTQKTKIGLTEVEQNKLQSIQKNFAENKELFLLYFDDIINKYGITSESDNLIERLNAFFVTNFNIDVSEAYDKGIEIINNENSIYCDFILYLKSITANNEVAEELFRDLLKLCQDSDFLVRISASKVFSKLTNPEQFQNYIRQQERNVYLDTQIVLHALCLNYSKNIKYDNVYYKITDELVDFVKHNPNIKLKVSKLYLVEVIYQLKLALLLIPFEDFGTKDYSNNIFYLFYNYLKKNDLLEEQHDTFSEFLENWLLVSEDDVYDESFEQIAKSNLKDLLKEELNIEVTVFPIYDHRESAVKILEKVIKDKLYSPKPHHVLVNDALMVCHLSDSEYHSTEPFFLTWDKTFTEFRKEYKNKFSRSELISWHLFGPSKFLNHMSLLNFKIDSKSITNEYLSIIDSFGLHEKTQTIYDSINRFLDLKNISKEQRRKYIQIAGSIFNEKEFSYEVKLPEETVIESISISFDIIIEEINKYYYSDKAPFTIDFYRKTMLKEDYFIKIANIIVEELKYCLHNNKLSNDYIEKLNGVLSDYDKEIKMKHNII